MGPHEIADDGSVFDNFCPRVYVAVGEEARIGHRRPVDAAERLGISSIRRGGGSWFEHTAGMSGHGFGVCGPTTRQEYRTQNER